MLFRSAIVGSIIALRAVLTILIHWEIKNEVNEKQMPGAAQAAAVENTDAVALPSISKNDSENDTVDKTVIFAENADLTKAENVVSAESTESTASVENTDADASSDESSNDSATVSTDNDSKSSADNKTDTAAKDPQ